MDIDFFPYDNLHRLGESATHPIEPRCGALAALLLLAGTSPQRPAQAKRMPAPGLAIAPQRGSLGHVQLPFLG